MTDEKLHQACPFCGNRNLSIQSTEFEDPKIGRRFWVACHKHRGGCNSIGPEASSSPEAAELWDKRK